MDLCLAEERKLGMSLSRRWWENPALDIMGIRSGQVAEDREDDRGGGGGIGVRGRGRVGEGMAMGR